MPLQLFNMVFFDVVSACNLRCPFCSTDWTKVKPVRTKDDVVQKVFQLAPFAQNGSVSFSCRYEPTVHPGFAAIIRSVPEHLRKKFFFTTNFTTPMKDDLLEAIANSGFHHINISLDTTDPERFAIFRKNGEWSAFVANIDRFRLALTKADPAKRPDIHIISVALRSNIRDIPEVTTFAKGLGASLHEVRFIYDMFHIPAGYMASEIPDEASWDWLSAFAAKEPVLQVYRPPAGYRYYFQKDEQQDGARALRVGAGVKIEREAELIAPMPALATWTPQLHERHRTPYSAPTIFIDPDGAAFSNETATGHQGVNLMDGDALSIIRSILPAPSWDDLDALSAKIDEEVALSNVRSKMIVDRDTYIRDLKAALAARAGELAS